MQIDINKSPCCSVFLAHNLSLKALTIHSCESCNTKWAVHHKTFDGDPWLNETVTEDFLRVLKVRRKLQADKIVKEFGNILRAGKVLDYGCGQGAFVSYLISNGIDAIGCDLSEFSQNLDYQRPVPILQLTKSWEVPVSSSFHTVVLLDVLEHCSKPKDLINNLSSTG